MTLGELLREKREKARYSQRALAKLLGVFYQQIQNWETNRQEPRIGVLFSMCKLLDISLDELRAVVLSNEVDPVK
jgi:transcriptional regulator with XRE-family HTH domain